MANSQFMCSNTDAVGKIEECGSACWEGRKVSMIVIRHQWAGQAVWGLKSFEILDSNYGIYQVFIHAFYMLLYPV